MKILLKKMDETNTINSRDFKEMVGRNYKIDFPFTMNDFSTVSSTYNFDELYLFLQGQSYLEEQLTEDKAIAVTAERMLFISNKMDQIDLMLEELSFIEDNLSNQNISDIRLIGSHSDGIMFHEDRHLNVLFNEVEILVGRSKRPDDTRRALKHLNIGSNINIFNCAYGRVNLFTTPTSVVSLTDTLNIIKNGLVRRSLLELRETLYMDYVSVRPFVNIGTLQFHSHEEFNNICKLLTSITELN
jgi:hypothetical protein